MSTTGIDEEKVLPQVRENSSRNSAADILTTLSYI